MEEFDDDLKASLENDHPGYLKILEERAEDLMRKDCAVVITGKLKTFLFYFTYYCNCLSINGTYKD